MKNIVKGVAYKFKRRFRNWMGRETGQHTIDDANNNFFNRVSSMKITTC